ncbi:DUF4190 domain-containing protein [Herbiconiux sp. L3-i23]|uniref:DUF4190 domain-containing protein n=1 Tax=Herbiconiux sp. L3-i23 TaxID=2905871 RepID=UPI00206FA288|nr:DUF4190 domain-containing protein [Herbiconiux sp. L3-i23]BDI22593.1 hypothetical protein L3i23_13690 [Herbiconiux sp. L3-i23]
MASTAQLRLNIPVEDARNAVASVLTEQGFTVQSTPSGTLDVSRGSLGTTVIAGAFAGQDMHVRFDVHVTPTDGGAVAEFEHSAAGGFLKGGVIGASKASDVVREAAHLIGTRLAEQGLLEGSVPAAVPVGAEPAYVTGAAPAPQPAYSGAGSASIPPPIDYANRTNVVSIVALILGFLFPLGGIIAGAVGLAQVKRTGEKGRGLAIGGIVVGSIMTVLTILAVIGLVALAAFTSSQANDPTRDSLGAPPSQEDIFGGDSDDAPESVDVFTLQIGDCLNEASADVVSSVEAVDCAAPHDYEVFTEFQVPGDAFPGIDEVDLAASDGCYAAFPAFVGLSYEESTLDYSYFAPTEESWAGGDRLVSCLIIDPAAQTVGTLAGAGR